MFREKPHQSIRFRFMVVVGVILFAGAVLTAFVIAANESRMLVDSLRSTGWILASYMTITSADPMVRKNSLALDEIVLGAIQGGNVDYAVIYDEQGIPVTSEYASINYHLPRINFILLESPRDASLQDLIDTIKKKESTVEISLPIVIGPRMINDRIIGRIAIGMSVHDIYIQFVKSLAFTILLNTLVAFILVAILLFVSKRLVFRPLEELVTASSRLARGDHSIALEIAATGEVKTLVDSFNDMMKSLAEMTVSRDHVDSILKSMINTLMVISPGFEIKRANSAACKLLGYEEAELVGLPIDAVFHEKGSRKDSWMKALLAHGQVSDLEDSYRTRDGREVPVLLSASVMREADPAIWEIVLVAQDITDRKRAEVMLLSRMHLMQYARVHSLKEVLQETLDRIGALTDSPIGFYHFLEPDQKTLSLQAWSTATIQEMCTAEVKTGHYSIDEAGVWVDCVRERRPIVHNDYAALSHRKGMPQGHATVVRELVVPVFRNEQIVAVLGVGNKPTGYGREDVDLVSLFADFAWDIAARKRAEKEEEKLQEQLLQVQKLESVGRLAGGVAHDLNNLLTPILGYGEMLLVETALDDPARASLKEIVDAGMRARDLVRQLLAFSRKQVLEYRRTDLNRIVAGFESLLRRTIPEDIRMEVIPSSAALPITVDLGQIEQVLLNLAVNAADAMPDGGTMTIETAAIDLDGTYAEARNGVEPGAYALLAVSDTGHGMDEETRARVFEPFYSTKGERGTGLGLATAYGIVKQHGGNIWVYSEPGKGTTFKVYLPLTETGITRPKDPTDRATAADLAGTETILLVEDNDQVRELTLAILRHQGYTVITAENGRDALTVLDRHEGPVHLLLTDVVMPGMNARELFARAAEKHPGLKVLFMSGYTDNVIAHRGVLDEGVAFIQKPFSVNALAAKVREVLEGNDE